MTERIAQLTILRVHLREAARYPAANPVACRALTLEAIPELAECARDWSQAGLHRLACNLVVGLRWLAMDPQVLESYLYAAAHELGVLRSELEKETAHDRPRP